MICVKHFVTALHRGIQKNSVVNNIKNTMGAYINQLPFYEKKKPSDPAKIHYRVELKKTHENNLIIYCTQKEALEDIKNSVNSIYSRLFKMDNREEYGLELTTAGINTLCKHWNTPYRFEDLQKELKSRPIGIMVYPEEKVNEFDLFKFAFYKNDKMPLYSYFFSEARKRIEKRGGQCGKPAPCFRDMKDVLAYTESHPGSDASKVVDQYFDHLKPRTIDLGLGAKLVIKPT